MKRLLILFLTLLTSCENQNPYLETKEIQTDAGILVIRVEDGNSKDTLGIIRKDSASLP